MSETIDEGLDAIRDAMDEAMPAIQCPKCGAELCLDRKIRAPKETVLTMKLTPEPGKVLRAKTVGETLANLDKALRAVGRELGANTHPLVKDLRVGPDGEITMDILIVNS